MTAAPSTRWCSLWIRATRCMKPTPEPEVIAPLIAAASGPLGTNAQYLFSLDQELTRLGMQDDCLSELVVKVKALLEGNPLSNTLRPGFA